jgi:acyl-CoA thioesterase-2
VADFAADTAVHRVGVDGDVTRLRAELSPAWEVWGPVGGYVAAIALRALAAGTELPRPASFHCNFLSVARFGAVDLEVATLRRGKRSHALRVAMTQQAMPILTATAWFVADGMAGLAHEHAIAPDVAPPHALKSYAEVADNYADWYPFWRSVEGRPVDGAEPRPPTWHTWMRLLATPRPLDPVTEAGRLLLWLDMMMWNAADAPHPWPPPYLAPNLDLSASFHELAPGEEWLLCDAHAPVAREGIIGCRGHLWTQAGRLLASANATLFCRPNPAAAPPAPGASTQV